MSLIPTSTSAARSTAAGSNVAGNGFEGGARDGYRRARALQALLADPQRADGWRWARPAAAVVTEMSGERSRVLERIRADRAAVSLMRVLWRRRADELVVDAEEDRTRPGSLQDPARPCEEWIVRVHENRRGRRRAAEQASPEGHETLELPRAVQAIAREIAEHNQPGTQNR
jgi:hypothetical protein